MRPITTLTMCAYLALLAAAPGLAASPAFLKLGGVDGESTKGKHGHKDEIEILSWSWGEAQSADALTDGLMIIRYAAPEGAAKVNKVEGIAIKQTVARNSVEKGESAPPAAGAAKFGAVSGVRRNDNLAPGVVEKRQHGWVTVSKPLDRGALRVKVKVPWMACRVGTRYPELTLGGGAQRYELRDAIITSCGSASSGGESLPMEEVSFNYGKVTVRGWNPEKKEE